MVRALGKAWAEADGNGGFQLKRGRPPEGALTEAQAAEKMLRIVRETTKSRHCSNVMRSCAGVVA